MVVHLSFLKGFLSFMPDRNHLHHRLRTCVPLSICLINIPFTQKVITAAWLPSNSRILDPLSQHWSSQVTNVLIWMMAEIFSHIQQIIKDRDQAVTSCSDSSSLFFW